MTEEKIMIPPDDDDVDEEEELVDKVAVEAAFEQLIKRCESAKIPVELGDFDGDKYLRINLPNGRETRSVTVYNFSRAQELLAIPFEKYVFLGEYEAICSYGDGTIEAALSTIGFGLTSRNLFRIFEGKSAEEWSEDENHEIELTNSSSSGQHLAIKPISETLPVLSRNVGLRGRPSLVLSGFQLSQHDQAVDLLETIANSLFFEIELSFGVSFGLRRMRVLRRPRRESTKREKPELQFPRNEYDKAPMELYWYARSASGMPLLQFLAYYQSIEYYFPTYSKAEAQRRIRGILKDPTFRPEREGDIGRILTAVQVGGSGFGDERSQIKATLQECLDPDRLREFLTRDEQIKEFYVGKASSQSGHKIPINSPTVDLRGDVAERIYDIRCKIVHTKSGNRDGELEILLAFSREAQSLQFDIELIQYVAREVLIAASSQLRI